MNKFLVVLVLALCLVAAHGKKKAKEEKENFQADETPKQEEAPEDEAAKAEPETEQLEEDQNDGIDDASAEEEDGDGSDEESKQFQCNLKFKKVGCYADKSKKQKPLKSFIMSDADMGVQTKRGKLPDGGTFNVELPKFACKCANEAINSGNAIFGIQNIAECWTGPDSSKYDKDGPSEDCVTFDFAQCAANSEICAGKKHANFVYYVDAPEHTKSQAEIQKELAAEAAKKKKQQKKKLNKKKGKKGGKKKGKKHM